MGALTNEPTRKKSNGRTRGSVSSRSDSTRTGRGELKVEFRGYVNLTLNDTDKAGFSNFIHDPERVASIFATVVEQGYKVAVTYDQYHKCFSGTLYCQIPEHANAGYCLAVKAGDPESALHRALFVHWDVFGEVWPTEESGAVYNPSNW